MTDRIEILGRNLEVTDHIRTYITKRAGKLSRHLREIDETRIELAYVKTARSASDRMVAQITVRGKGVLLRTEERNEDLLAAFDDALDKMMRQIERYKGKHYHSRRDGRSAAEVAAPLPATAEPEPPEPVIVRRKRFVVRPMKEADALEQMRLLAHDNFFIFLNSETGVLSVIYRRRDGTYGLIEPTVE